MPIKNRIAEFSDELKEWRQDFHRHPELAFKEFRTSDIVAEKLKSWGIEVHRNIAGTGVVGVLRGQGGSSRSIGIRADMDALPIVEAHDREHRSRNEGVMHACGHDGHTTMLLGAAKYLAETRNFDGVVNFIFQPAEENGGGGEVMVKEGLFNKFPCDAVYAAHTDPNVPLGTILASSGPVMAAADSFKIHIEGKGGHAARPQQAIDPVLIGSLIVVSLQSIVARRTSAFDSAVVGVSAFHAGSADNIIPEYAELLGTVRTFKKEVQEQTAAMLKQIVEQTAATHGAKATVNYHMGYPPVVNTDAQSQSAARAAASVVGSDKVVTSGTASMGGEDFSFMLLERPGCYVKFGQKADAQSGIGLHNHGFDFNDELSPIGASYFASLVEQELQRS